MQAVIKNMFYLIKYLFVYVQIILFFPNYVMKDKIISKYRNNNK